MQLPLKLPYDQLTSRWKSILDPIIGNPVTNPTLLSSISLTTGVNVINHKLGQMQQGWIITDIQGVANVYRSQPFNDKTLTLTSDADVTINLMVF